MKISFLTSLTLASSLVSAKLYFIDSEGNENDVNIPHNVVLNPSSLQNLLEKNDLNEATELRFDKATVDDLLALSKEFFNKNVLTPRQVVDLVINEKISLFKRLKEQKNKKNKREKRKKSAMNLVESGILSRLEGVLEKLPEISPSEVGADKDEFVAALPVEAYEVVNPATVLLSENAIISEAAIATLFNLTGEMVEKFLQDYLGLDNNSIGIINKVTKMVAHAIAKIIKFTGPDRIFKILHQLTTLVNKVPVLGGIVGPRLEALGQAIVLHVANMGEQVKKALKRANRKTEKLNNASMNEKTIYADIASLVFGRSMKNGEEFVDQDEGFNFTRKSPVGDNIEIEIDDSNTLPAHQNNNNNNNVVTFGRPPRRQHGSRHHGSRRTRHNRHHNKNNKVKLVKGKHCESSESSNSSKSSSSSGSTSGDNGRF